MESKTVTIMSHFENVCCKQVTYDLNKDTHIVTNIKFVGGCQGNLKAVAKLCDGKKAEEICELLSSITCHGSKSGSSCAREFTKALHDSIKHGSM